MKTARDLMQAPLTVAPSIGVKDLANLLLRERVDGACVVDGDRLVGVVTAMDLIHREKSVPSMGNFSFLDALIPVSPDAQAEVERMFASRAGELMSQPPITVQAEDLLVHIADLLVDRHLTVLPVLEHGRLLGMITKPTLLQAIWGAGPRA